MSSKRAIDNEQKQLTQIWKIKTKKLINESNENIIKNILTKKFEES